MTETADPDMGSWQYQYDAVGNLTGQRDGRSQWLYLEYDALNRLIRKRRDSAGSGPLVAEYGYDATGQQGLLSFSKSYDSAGTAVEVEVQSVAYDARNRLTQQQWVVNGSGAFRMDYAYNEADQRTSLTYPGDNSGGQGEVVSHSYNAIGQLTGVSGSGVQYVSAASYNAQGQLIELRNDSGANGLTRQFVYETNTLRLSIIKAGTSSPYENLQQLSYTYDNAGNLTSLTDTLNSSQQQCFQYDWLDRLTAAFTGNGDCSAYSGTGTGPYNHTYTYDAIGNLTSYAGNSYTYGGGKPHAVTAAFGNSYGYDNNGNQTSRTIGGTAYTFTFDYENRLTAISGGSVSATFVYDANGNRVKGTVGGVTTVYIAGVYEYQGGATTHYYEGNAFRRTGYGSDNGVFYLLQDHLKSSSTVINQNGTLNSQNYYFPFGGNRGSAFSTLTTKRFTGQYHEIGLPGGEGLSYYNARWYDARLGRFISADSIVPESGNPQALNRFSYVLNNPTLLTDPSGHCPVGYCMLHETNPVGSSGPYIPQSNGQRYFVTNYYGFTIDVSHFEAGMERGREIFRDLDAGRSTTAVRDQIKSYRFVGAFGYTSTYAIFRHPTTRAERESVAWGIYLHSQHLFERWQGSGWLSPGNEWWRGSSYANEDLPSDYLGFYAAARYPHLSSETALKVIARQLGGGMWTGNEPAHARFFGYGHITVPRGTRAVPLYWGDLGLKNYHPTPRVAGASGWYNVAWPASLRIRPMGQGTYWGYQHSINTRNGQPWPW